MTDGKAMSETLSISEAAEIIGVSYNQIYKLVKDGTLSAFKLRKNWRIISESVNAYKERSQPEIVTEINGERVFLAWEFAQEIGLPFTTYHTYISNGKLKVIKMHSRNYITESEKKRFLNRDKEIMGYRVVNLNKAAKLAGHSNRWIVKKIKEGKIEAVADGVKYHVFLDSLKEFVAQEKKGQNLLKDKTFLRIPHNGKRRVKTLTKEGETE